MIWFLSIVAFIVIFSVLILIHELGHFTAAKLSGIKVEEFGLGIPPRIWGYKPKKSDTLYSLNAIPFGGFVKLYGEDAVYGDSLNSKKSFASKSVGQKLLVVVAGVLMNFLLAFLLLVIGFSIGIQPLLVTPEDVYDAVDTAIVQTEQGVIVKEVSDDSSGIKVGDEIISINGNKVIFGDEFMSLQDGEKVNIEISREGELKQVDLVYNKENPIFSTYDVLPMPHLIVGALKKENDLGLMNGDIIEKVNGKTVADVNLLNKILANNDSVEITLANRQWDGENATNNPVLLTDEFKSDIVVSMVLPGANAEEAGLIEGDQVLEINGVELRNADDVSLALKATAMENRAAYTIWRNNEQLQFYIKKGDDGMIGVVLAELVKIDDGSVAVYTKSVPYSVIKINDVRYPFFGAIKTAFWEMGRLSVITVETFGNVFSSVFTQFRVPEGVAGPIGIAKLTFVFTQEGVMSLIRFMALLSLSLGIINILPFPGLDGGRFLLIIVPFILRRKIDARLEAVIHVFGFFVLMFLLFLITLNDLSLLFM